MERARRKLVLIGSNGMLASAIRRLVSEERYELSPFDLPEFDLSDPELVRRVLAGVGPDIILNCAAYTDVDGCEAREEFATKVNGFGPGHLARTARELGATLVHLSTDYVFDGTKGSPYVEDDPPNPQSAYGRSKLLGERQILESGLDRFYIVRTSWLYGPNGKNFVETIARLAREREELRIVADQTGSPTHTADLAQALYTLLDFEDGSTSRRPAYGLYHFSNEGACTWFDFACAIVERLRRAGQPVRVQRVLPIGTEEYPLPAKRPAYSVLSKDKYREATGTTVPGWEESLGRYFEDRNA
jgi:dTDP-4-dehydrorhamnose reductase